jgi:hypothetical protein
MQLATELAQASVRRWYDQERIDRLLTQEEERRAALEKAKELKRRFRSLLPRLKKIGHSLSIAADYADRLAKLNNQAIAAKSLRLMEIKTERERLESQLWAFMRGPAYTSLNASIYRQARAEVGKMKSRLSWLAREARELSEAPVIARPTGRPPVLVAGRPKAPKGRAKRVVRDSKNA